MWKDVTFRFSLTKAAASNQERPPPSTVQTPTNTVVLKTCCNPKNHPPGDLLASAVSIL